MTIVKGGHGAMTEVIDVMGEGRMVIAADPTGGIFTAPEAQPEWRVYFAVSETDATAAISDSNGATVVTEPRDTPFGRMAVIQDPQGAVFALLSSPQS